MKGNDGNLREWVYIARGIQVNAGECRGMPGDLMGVDANCNGNAGEYRGMQGERMGVCVNCQGNAGNAGECQGNGV